MTTCCFEDVHHWKYDHIWDKQNKVENTFSGRRGRDRMVVDLQLPMQSVSITTDVVSSNLDQGEVYNIMW
jgi:hypothetical protein